MTVLWGKDLREMDRGEFLALAAGFSGVCADIGTGDARQLYRLAARDPARLYVGVDPVRDQMLDIAVRLRRKPEKGGLGNLLLAVAAVERLPEALTDTAEQVSVSFPWGSLLEAVVRPVPASLRNLAAIARDGASFAFLFTYAAAYEGGEMERRQLPPLSLDYLNGAYRDTLAELGFQSERIEALEGGDARTLGTRWAKRLASGRARVYYRVEGRIRK